MNIFNLLGLRGNEAFVTSLWLYAIKTIVQHLATLLGIMHDRCFSSFQSLLQLEVVLHFLGWGYLKHLKS